MTSFSKFALIALVAFSGVAARAHDVESRPIGQVLPVVSARGTSATLTSVHTTGHRHHHRRHRAHPVRHVR